jgi:hypothetical protein
MVSEDEELIQLVLDAAGETLTFSGFTIKGIPGFELQILYKGEESLYEVERQNISFHTSVHDLAVNSVTDADEFTCSDRTYLYTFVVEGIEPDFTGWAFMKVSFKSRVLV